MSDMRSAALRWVGGVYLLLLGASLLILPQSSVAPFEPLVVLRASVTAAGGLLLLWVSGLGASISATRLTCLCVGISQVVLGAVAVIQGPEISANWSLAAMLALFGLPLALSARSRVDKSPDVVSGDGLGIAFGTITASRGVYFLLYPTTSLPFLAPLGVAPEVGGWAYLLAGLSVAALQFWPRAPLSIKWAVHLAAGAVVLAFWVGISYGLDPIYWTLGASSVIRGTAMAILPWLSCAATRISGRSARTQFAVALGTAPIIPLLIALPVIVIALGPAATPAVRTAMFATTLAIGVVSTAISCLVASRLTFELRALAATVERLSDGRAVRIPTPSGMELAALAEAIWTTTRRLAARTEEAQEAVRARDQLLAIVTHDLRNPLTSIKGYTDYLRRHLARFEAPVSERVLDTLARLDQVITRMNTQVDELVGSSRHEQRPAGACELGPVDVVGLVRRIADEQQQATDRDQIVVETESPQFVGSWDPVRLDRVFANLLSNAVRYSPSSGTIGVIVGREEDAHAVWVVVQVTDEGVGIPANDLPRIFEPYHRASNVGEIPGSGLGLASVQQIVREMGGSVAVASEEGKGSKFVVRLPLATSQAPPAHSETVPTVSV